MSNEAFARVKIDALLAAQGWDTFDANAVRVKTQLSDGTRVDYVATATLDAVLWQISA